MLQFIITMLYRILPGKNLNEYEPLVCKAITQYGKKHLWTCDYIQYNLIGYHFSISCKLWIKFGKGVCRHTHFINQWIYFVL